MPSRTLDRTSLAVLALAFLALAPACGGKRTPALANAQPGGAEDMAAADAASRRPATETVSEGPDLRPIDGGGASASDIAGGATSGEGGPLADVRFDLDSASLNDAARATLEKHAAWLQGQRGTSVVIEGHCDERGTVEYNLALGEQRARATREYLVSLGVSESRLKVVSFGKERLLDPGADEAAHAKNRRAHFNVR